MRRRFFCFAFRRSWRLSRNHPGFGRQFSVASDPAAAWICRRRRGRHAVAHHRRRALQEKLGQPIIVEAKPGAGGNIAADAIAKAAPDGYTIGLVTGAHAISAATYKSLAYQPAESFEMISTLVYYALVIAVRSDYPAKSLGELVAMAKQKPGALSFGSVGFGSTHHLAGELLNAAAGVEIVHVPYRGDSQWSPHCSAERFR